VSSVLFVIVSVYLSLIAISCSKYKLRPDLKPEERMSIAMKMFEKRDYLDAQTQFRILTLSHGGSSIADKAQFYLAECHYFLKEYILAANEYDRTIKVFPNSEYVDDAKYKLGMSYFKLAPKYSLDQEYTLKAIKEFQEFIEDYYSSPLAPEVEAKLQESRDKLAKKLYAAADQYRKMGYFSSAKVYFELVLERFYDSEYAERALFWQAESQFRLDELEQAEENFKQFIEKYPKHEYISRAKDRLEKIRAKLEQSASVVQQTDQK
jgi:outer membrane protein assembly factor BamD